MPAVAAPRHPAGSMPNRPLWRRTAVAVAMIAVAIAAVVAAGAVTAAFAPPGAFSDPGVVSRYGLPVTSVLVEIAASITLGSLVLAACVVPQGAGWDRVLDVSRVGCAAWVVLGVAQFVFRYAVISGSAPRSEAFGTGLWAFATQLALGRNQTFALIAIVIASIATLCLRGPVGAMWTSVLVLAALAAQANTGHAAGAVSHGLPVASMFLHLVGAGLWIGGLSTLALIRTRQPATGTAGTDALGMNLAVVVQRYSTIATWCFVAVGVSGTVSAALRVTRWSDLASDYGTLVVAKIVLTIVLGVFGFAHRELVIHGLRTATGRAATALFWRLALGELFVMGAVVGVAVALGSSPPPAPQASPGLPTPAELVMGHRLPPEPTAISWFTQWRPDLLFGFAVAAGLLVYLRWVYRLTQRGDHWPLGRTLSWCAGMLVVGWVTSGGPAVYGHVLFSAHMVQHMILAMVAPILLVLAAPITLLVRAVPKRTDGTRGPREWVLAIVQSRWGQFFAHPVVAAVNFAGSMIVFYFTDLFRLALTTYVGHVAMVVHFTVAGYLFASALVGIDPGPTRPPYPQRLLLLFATMAFHAFFGVALTEGTALLVPEWFGLLGRDWGPSAIVDQQRGGAVAWGIGELPTLVLAIVVAVGWMRSDQREARRQDRQADRDGDAELAQYNARLAQLAQRDDPDAVS